MHKKSLFTFRRVAIAAMSVMTLATSMLQTPGAVHALENGTYTKVPCDTSKSVWDRPECAGYYTGVSRASDREGAPMFDDGDLVGVNNKSQFIDSIRDHLYATNDVNARRHNVAAAGIIAVMLNKKGTEFSSTNQGVQFAKDNFGKWVDVINYYDANNLIRWNYIFAPTEPFYNSGYSWYYDDMYTRRSTYSDTLMTIRFDVPPGATGIPFMIDKYCANMKGTGLFPVQSQFAFAGDTTIAGNDQNTNGSYVTGKKTIYATPGSTVTFTHNITNTGASTGATQYTASAVAPNGTVSNAPPKTTNPTRPNPGSISLNAGQQQTVNDNRFTIPANATPGQRYCQYVSFTPAGSGGGNGGGVGTQACVEVTYNYNLVPAAAASETLGSTGGTVTFTYNVNNSGQTPSKSDTKWSVQEVVLTPGTTLNTPNGNNPYTDGGACSLYAKPGATCRQLGGESTQTFNQGNTAVTANSAATTLTLNGYSAGTIICRVLTVDPPTQSGNPRNRWSNPTCVTVGKYPTVHFMSGDISAGGAYPDTLGACSQRNNTGNVYTAANSVTSGSTVEYGAFARGKINQNAGSKKGFGTASLSATDTQRIIAWRLAFANTGNPAGQLGDTPHCMNDYYARYSPQISGQSPPATIKLSDITDERVHYTGDLTIEGSSIPTGKRLIVIVDGNVTITDNITYPGAYASAAEIPSIAIVAKGNITVQDNVTRLDGAYSTKDTFATCQTTTGLSTQVCRDQLVVNGVVFTDKLQLARTFGADSGSGSDPAERFVYGVELLYSNVLEPAVNTSRVDVVNEQDLPPRF